MLNQIIAHYRVLKKLGQGGMGEVYLAEDLNLPRQVAIKFMALEYAGVPELRDRFRREAKAAARIDHPNVVTIYEVGEFNNRPYLVMQYVDGGSLANLIAQRELSIEEVLDIGLQICAGLAKAHQKGVLHRDLKPANILIDLEGRIKIVDFGLAKLRDASSITSTGEVMGTPAYMSPEQVRGQKLDPRSDIFSLGVILYQLITRQLPFAGNTREALYWAILQQEPEPMARYKRGVPAGVQRLVDKALDKDRETRHQIVESFLADLKREKKLLVGTAPPTVPLLPKEEGSKPKPETPKPTRSWWPPRLAFAGVGIILLVIFIVYLLSLREGDDAKPLSSETQTPATATVTIRVKPADAEVILDGERRSAAQLTARALSVGAHSLPVAARLQASANPVSRDRRRHDAAICPEA